MDIDSTQSYRKLIAMIQPNNILLLLATINFLAIDMRQSRKWTDRQTNLLIISKKLLYFIEFSFLNSGYDKSAAQS